jgi:hypothetical protein
MKKQTLVILLGVASLGGATAVHAHHSFPATYHVERTQTIQGQVVAFLFRNPHSFVQVLAPDRNGKQQRWAIEWSAGAALAADNVTAKTLRVGDKVTVTGNPGRSSSDHRMRMNKIVRPADGWRWEGNVE